jgi:hypothetical protein
MSNINRKYRSDLTDQLDRAGFDLIEDIRQGNGHVTLHVRHRKTGTDLLIRGVASTPDNYRSTANKVRQLATRSLAARQN